MRPRLQSNLEVKPGPPNPNFLLFLSETLAGRVSGKSRQDRLYQGSSRTPSGSMTHKDTQFVTMKGQSKTSREKAPGEVQWTRVQPRTCLLLQLQAGRTQAKCCPLGKLPRLKSRVSLGSPSWKLQIPRGHKIILLLSTI